MPTEARMIFSDDTDNGLYEVKDVEIIIGKEGSYIPLVIYKDRTAIILVNHNEVSMWSDLTQKLADVLKMPVTTRGD